MFLSPPLVVCRSLYRVRGVSVCLSANQRIRRIPVRGGRDAVIIMGKRVPHTGAVYPPTHGVFFLDPSSYGSLALSSSVLGSSSQSPRSSNMLDSASPSPSPCGSCTSYGP